MEKAFKTALAAAKSLGEPRLGGEVLVAYTGPAEAPARILYTALTHSGARTLLAPAVEAARHIAPYRDLDTVIVYSHTGRDPRSLALAETATLLGAGKVYLVAPPLHPAYRERAESLGVEVIELPGEAPPLLTMALASLHWAPRQMGGRAARLEAELEELHTALEWVSEALGPSPGYRGLQPYYTPAAKPGAIIHCLPQGCVPRPLEDLLAQPRGSNGLAYITTVEEQDYRDVLSSHTARGLRLETIRINTDPITAGLYSMLAAMLVQGTHF